MEKIEIVKVASAKVALPSPGAVARQIAGAKTVSISNNIFFWQFRWSVRCNVIRHNDALSLSFDEFRAHEKYSRELFAESKTAKSNLNWIFYATFIGRVWQLTTNIHLMELFSHVGQLTVPNAKRILRFIYSAILYIASDYYYYLQTMACRDKRAAAAQQMADEMIFNWNDALMTSPKTNKTQCVVCDRTCDCSHSNELCASQFQFQFRQCFDDLSRVNYSGLSRDAMEIHGIARY